MTRGGARLKAGRKKAAWSGNDKWLRVPGSFYAAVHAYLTRLKSEKKE
jgi:hypothetical protein